MSAVAAAVLEPVGQARVALQGVAVEARLQGLLSEVTVTQTYRNLEDTAIEATYTFPLPLDAVLLELTLELNGRQLQGVVQPKAAGRSSATKGPSTTATPRSCSSRSSPARSR